MTQHESQKPLVSGEFMLQKFDGKGGWTYAELPDIQKDKNTPFGWKRVRGFIDDYEISQFHLMPMGNGRLFLSVKKEIRMALKKEAGDTVCITLYPDQSLVATPEELKECLLIYDGVWDTFQKLSEGEKKYYLDWISKAIHAETKANRINKLIDDLQKGVSIYGRKVS